MRSARLKPTCRNAGLDANAVYRVLGPDDVEGYIWIGGDGIGDPFVNPGRRYVWAEHFDIVEET